jgi:nitrite reductase (NO-forming)
MQRCTKRFIFTGFVFVFLVGLILSGCAGGKVDAPENAAMAGTDLKPTISYTLKTGFNSGKMVFFGQGGEIDGIANPELTASPGDVVAINLVDGDGAEHTVAVPEFNAQSESVVGAGSTTTLVFKVDHAGEYVYYCTIPGHRQAGMEGRFVVGSQAGSAQVSGEPAVDIVRDPADLPAPVGDRAAKNVRIDLEAVELNGQLADGTAYGYWTFGGKVPGPFLRVRVGDTVELHLANREGNRMVHSIDLHAVTGPGGGSSVTQVPPGDEKAFTFKALHPGLFVYHCATPMVAQHIANGMYGLILVEPEGGLPEVDREFYVMQGEVYTHSSFGEGGQQELDVDKLLDEAPEYYVFNGAVGGLTEDHPLHAKIGETVRIFMGVGGPNFASSFHVIGEIMDRVYDQASLTSPPLTDVQTTLVPPGGATLVELGLDVPGRYLLVDHAIARVEQGLVGYLIVDGPENQDIFHSLNSGSSSP